MYQSFTGTHPLQGMRVVDLSTILFGPYASRWLADYGADVIKVESPEGDDGRQIGMAREPGMGAGHLSVNRNKRSVVLDLKQQQGRDTLLRLLETADVVMHNIRPQKLAALGLDPETLRARFPRLVCAQLTGFGADGPYSGLPAYDDIVQGMCGLADLMHRRTGEMQYLPTVAADKIAGLIGAQAILAALVARERTGCGQLVEVPMFECMVNFTLLEHSGGRCFVPPEGNAGYARVLAKWRRPYPTADGFVCAMPYTTEQWRRFFAEIGKPELANDPRFASMASRSKFIEELYALVGEQMRLRTSQHWLDTCLRLDIPVGRVNTLEDLENDPHLRAVDFFEDIPNADRKGAARLPKSGVRINGQSPALRAAPRLGQDTVDVLCESGFTADEIEALLESGAARTVRSQPV